MTIHKIPEIGSKRIIKNHPGVPRHLRGREAYIVGCKLRVSVGGEGFDIDPSALEIEHEPVINAIWTGEGEPEVGQWVDVPVEMDSLGEWAECEVAYIYKDHFSLKTFLIVKLSNCDEKLAILLERIRPIKTQAQRDAEAEEKRVDSLAQEMYEKTSRALGGAVPVPWTILDGVSKAEFTNLIKSGWTKNEA